MKNIIMKLISVLLLVLLISFNSTVEATAIPSERLLPRLVDEAGLLTHEEGDSLLLKLDEISERQNLDVVIVTVDSLGGKSSTEYADDFFDYNGYGMGTSYDGILLLISMEERDWAISTTGYGITVFTDVGQRYMMDEILKYLSDGNYAKAFNSFADLSDEFITNANTSTPSTPYDSRSLPEKPLYPHDSTNLPKRSLPPKWIGISFVIGAIIGFTITGIMKSSLKTVSRQRAASSYIRANSLNITRSRELFLYSVVNKRARPKEQKSSSGSSTHRSSSGRSHGGSSGKF